MINTRPEADALPTVDDKHPFRSLNAAVIDANSSFADAYQTEPVPHGELAATTDHELAAL
ncbi:MAG: hypothetical protein FJ090_12000 [Deltaproteobacteria bacterium]|nr:hypothetical protein [Deltaproteobacteria bacterium]